MEAEERLEEIGRLAEDLLNPSKHHHPSASCPTCRTGAALDDLLAVAEAAREYAALSNERYNENCECPACEAELRLREALNRLEGGRR